MRVACFNSPVARSILHAACLDLRGCVVARVTARWRGCTAAQVLPRRPAAARARLREPARIQNRDERRRRPRAPGAANTRYVLRHVARAVARASCRIAAARHRDLSWGARSLPAPRLELRSPVPAQRTTPHHSTQHNTAEARAGTLCAQLIVQLLPVATAERLARTAFDSAHSAVTKLQRYAPVVPVVAATLLCLFASNSV